MVCDSTSVLRFGKHRGESFAAAFGDRRYVDWVLTKKEAARGQFLEFCEFCESAREREKGPSAPRKRKAVEMGALESTGSGSAATAAMPAISGPGPREAAIASALTDLLHEFRKVRDELPVIARDIREARAAIASANV